MTLVPKFLKALRIVGSREWTLRELLEHVKGPTLGILDREGLEKIGLIEVGARDHSGIKWYSPIRSPGGTYANHGESEWGALLEPRIYGSDPPPLVRVTDIGRTVLHEHPQSRTRASSGRKRGRLRTSDPAADAKLVRDWSESGQSQKDFERARGLPNGSVTAAKNRLKSAARRGRVKGEPT